MATRRRLLREPVESVDAGGRTPQLSSAIPESGRRLQSDGPQVMLVETEQDLSGVHPSAPRAETLGRRSTSLDSSIPRPSQRRRCGPRSRIFLAVLVDLVMAPSSQGVEPPRFPARFQSPPGALPGHASMTSRGVESLPECQRVSTTAISDRLILTQPWDA
jgi:hypothetical protein